MKSRWHRLAMQLDAGLLSAVLVFVQASLVAQPAFAQASPGADQLTPEQALDQVDHAFDALEAAYKEIPRDTFDPQAALDIAGLDAKDLFQWVRDNTYYVPYGGALRGAVGVLLDRTGNSLDRALLLNELLHQLGYQTRLARAQLSEAQAEDLLARVRPVPVEGPLPPSQSAENQRKDLHRYAGEFGLDASLLSGQMDEMDQDQERLRKLSAERVAEQTAFLLEMIGSPPPAALAERRAQRIAMLQDHWWVQYQDGANWVGLDPMLPDAAAGQALAEPAETRFVASLNNLDESLLHSVRIRVVLECWYNGGLHEETLLESPGLRPSELLGQALALQHIAVDWPANLDLAGADHPQELLKSTVLAQAAWAPALRMGAKTLLDRSYTGDCKFGNAVSDLSAVGKLSSAVTSKLDRVADALGGPDQSAVEPREGGRVTAQWIEYELAIPGQPAKTIRRQVFDLVGPAARMAGLHARPELSAAQELSWRLALLGQTDILLLGSRLSPEFREHLAMKSVIDERQFLTGLLRSISSGQHAGLTSLVEAAPSPPSDDLYTLAVARTSWSDAPGGVYLDQVNILSRHTQFRWNAGGQLAQITAYDIVANAVAANAASADSAFSANLRQGVIDTDAEALLANESCRNVAQTAACLQRGGTSELYFAAKAQGVQWVAVKSVSELAERAGGLDADTRARIQQELAAGYVVLLPEAAVELNGRPAVAWWRVSPGSGEVLGIVENGWGADMLETLVIIANVAMKAISGYLCVMDVLSLSPMGAFFSCMAVASGFGPGKGFWGPLKHAGVGGLLMHAVLVYLDFALSGGMPGFNEPEEKPEGGGEE